MAKSYEIAFKLGAKVDKSYSTAFKKAEQIANKSSECIGKNNSTVSKVSSLSTKLSFGKNSKEPKNNGTESIEKGYNKAFKSIETSASNTVGKIIKTFGVITAATLGANAITGAVDTYKNFEQSMANTGAIAGVKKGTETYNALEKSALDAGKATSKTAQESADALGYMALAGWSAEDSMKGLMPILKASEATGADLATTSDLVTDSMSALGLKVDDLDRYLDVAAKANNKSNQTLTQLMEAYIGCGGVLKGFNTDITESSALLGVLANRGIKGSEAGNKLSTVLINLTAKTGQSYQAMKKLGINAYDQQGNFKGVTNVLEELRTATSELTDEQRDNYKSMIGGRTQIDTLNALMAGLSTTTADGSMEFYALQKELENSTGSLGAMADAVNDTMTGAFARLDSAVDDFKINMVQQFAPIITPAINKVAESIPKITEAFTNSISSVKDFGKNFTSGLGNIDGIFENFKPSLPLIQTSAKYFVSNFSDGVKRFFSGENLSSSFAESLSGLKGVVNGTLNGLDGKSIGEFTKLPIIDSIELGVEHISNVIETIKSGFSEIHNAYSKSFGGIADSIQPFVNTFLSAFGDIQVDKFHIFTDIFDSIKDILIQSAPVITNLITNIVETISTFAPVATKISDSIGTVIKSVLPIITDTFKSILNDTEPLMDGIATAVNAFAPVISSAIDKIMEYLPSILPVLQSLGSTVGNVIAKIGETIGNLSPLFAGVFNFICQSVIPVAMPIITTIGTVISSVVDIVANTLPIIGTLLSGIWEFSEPLLTGMSDIFSFCFGAIATCVSTTITSVKNYFDNLIIAANGVISFVQNIFSGNWEAAWENVKDIFGAAFNALAGLVKTPINGVISIINTAISSINSISVSLPDWVPFGLGGKTFEPNIPTIPMLAKGSEYSPSTFIAGEKGAELITDRRGSKVYDSIQTDNIFNKLSGFGTYNDNLDDNNNRDNASSSSLSLKTNGINTTPISINYSPQIKIEGGNIKNNEDLKGLIDEALKNNLYDLKQIIEDTVNSMGSRRERISNE